MPKVEKINEIASLKALDSSLLNAYTLKALQKLAKTQGLPIAGSKKVQIEMLTLLSDYIASVENYKGQIAALEAHAPSSSNQGEIDKLKAELNAAIVERQKAIHDIDEEKNLFQNLKRVDQARYDQLQEEYTKAAQNSNQCANTLQALNALKQEHENMAKALLQSSTALNNANFKSQNLKSDLKEEDQKYGELKAKYDEAVQNSSECSNKIEELNVSKRDKERLIPQFKEAGAAQIEVKRLEQAIANDKKAIAKVEQAQQVAEATIAQIEQQNPEIPNAPALEGNVFQNKRAQGFKKLEQLVVNLDKAIVVVEQAQKAADATVADIQEKHAGISGAPSLFPPTPLAPINPEEILPGIKAGRKFQVPRLPKKPDAAQLKLLDEIRSDVAELKQVEKEEKAVEAGTIVISEADKQALDKTEATLTAKVEGEVQVAQKEGWGAYVARLAKSVIVAPINAVTAISGGGKDKKRASTKKANTKKKRKVSAKKGKSTKSKRKVARKSSKSAKKAVSTKGKKAALIEEIMNFRMKYHSIPSDDRVYQKYLKQINKYTIDQLDGELEYVKHIR